MGYVRDNLFTTFPEMKDFSQLATWLHEKMVQDQNRPHYEKGILIKYLWLADRKQLPIKDLPIYTVTEAIINKYGEISLDGEKHLIRKGKVKHALVFKKEWDSFTCFTSEGEKWFIKKPAPTCIKPVTSRGKMLFSLPDCHNGCRQIVNPQMGWHASGLFEQLFQSLQKAL